MARLEIHVTGAGSAIRRAERGILVLQAHSQQLATAEEASATVTATAHKLRNIIAPYCPQDEETGRTKENAPIAHYSMSTLDTTSHRERIGRPASEPRLAEPVKYETTYSARVDLNIKFSDFNLLDTLATQFSAMQNVRIQKIDWRLTDATLASIEGGARKQAAQNALQHARDYAEVFANLSPEEAAAKVKAIDVKESQYFPQSTRPRLHYGKGQRMQVISRDDVALTFEPEDVSFEVRVDGKFIVEV